MLAYGFMVQYVASPCPWAVSSDLTSWLAHHAMVTLLHCSPMQALLWMFNDSRSFYFCLDSDITQSLQRQLNNTGPQHLPFWQRVSLPYYQL